MHDSSSGRTGLLAASGVAASSPSFYPSTTTGFVCRVAGWTTLTRTHTLRHMDRLFQFGAAATARAARSRTARIVIVAVCGAIGAQAQSPAPRAIGPGVFEWSGDSGQAWDSEGGGDWLVLGGDNNARLVTGAVDDAFAAFPPRAAWRFERDWDLRQLTSWPAGAELVASIDSVSPQKDGVWITAGAEQGAAVDGWWWARRRGQPVARIQIVSVAAGYSFGRLELIASDYAPKPGDAITRWMRPSDLRSHVVRTAIVAIDETTGDGGADARAVWIAAPPVGAWASGPRVIFQRDGVRLGAGMVDHRAELIWRVRVGAGTDPETLRVGDEALARLGDADGEVDARFGRVFDREAAGALVDLGEIDGIRDGLHGVVIAAAGAEHPVEVARLQRSYCVIRAVESSEFEAPVGALVCFGPRPVVPQLGFVESVADGGIVWAQTHPDLSPPVGVLVSIHDGGHCAAAALVVANVGARTLLRVLPHARVERFGPGARIEW